MAIDATTKDLVRRRAGMRCEYCLLHQEHAMTRHHVEHVIARKHGGSDEEANLALVCQHCNCHKGTNLSGIDPDTGSAAPLFHPRRDGWDEHFELRGPLILGRTPIGRTTVAVLAMNMGRRLEVRRELIERGLYP